MPAESVAELALRDPRPEYQSLALDIFYETARDTEGFDRLRTLAGWVDATGARTIQELRQIVTSQADAIATLTEAGSARERRLAEMAEARARDERTTAWLEAARREAMSEVDMLRRQLRAALGPSSGFPDRPC